MALTYSQLQSISHNNFDPKIRQQIFEESPFWAWLKNHKKIVTGAPSDGTTFQWPIRTVDYDTAESVGMRAQLTFESKETRTAAVDTAKLIRSTATIFLDEVLNNQDNVKIVNLLEDKSKELAEDFAKEIATQTFATAAASSNDLTPLATIIDSATTYAGIAVADAASWASIENGTDTTLTPTVLQTATNSATFGKNMPSAHFTTRNILSTYERIMMPYMRYESSDTNKVAEWGFGALAFKGAPVVSEIYCPAGYWYGLDMDSIMFLANKEANFKVSDWKSLWPLFDESTQGKVMATIGNFKCTMRKSSFKLTAIDYTLG